MHRKTITKLAATALAVAAAAPAVALADVELASAPKLTQASAHQATLSFTTEDALPRSNGAVDGKVRFGGRSYTIGTSSHDDNRYFARLKRSQWKEGATYTVTIAIAGEEPVVRRVRLR